MKRSIITLLYISISIAAISQQPLGSLNAEFTLGFEWSLHSRFIPQKNFELNTPLVNGYSRTGHKYLDSYVHPAGYGATLKLIVSNQALINGNISYIWEIKGLKKDDQTSNPFFYTVTTTKKTLYAGSSTAVDTEPDVLAMPLFPFRGTYKVKVSAIVKKPATSEIKVIKELERNIEIKDYLIVVMGDSFASGEGNPDKGGNYDVISDDDNAVWLEPRAHRSYKGALSLIAAEIEAGDPHSCVTFINVATSGAKTSNGLLFQQHEDWQIKGQVEEVKDYVKNRKVDMILLAIGLNDFGKVDGMSELIMSAVNPAPPEFQQSSQYRFAKDIVRNIEFRYDEVYDKIINTLNCKNVALFQMPVQFMRNANGNLTDGCGLLTTMEDEDILKLEDLGNQLIAKQKQICNKFQWTYIDGIKDLFKNHGYCAGNQSWFVFINSSRENQGDVNGAIHPNELGHRKIAELAFPSIKRKLEEVIVPARPANNLTTTTNK